MRTSLFPSPLFIDLYELTMAAGYWDRNMHARATFSLFLRAQPRRGYYVAAGLESALTYLERYRFDADAIGYLEQTGLFKPAFLEYLSTLRFSGNVRALPEGTLFFPDEPILEVTAPIIEAQMLETYLINTIGLHTLIATKAARCMYAARGRSLIDFALRRTQGIHTLCQQTGDQSGQYIPAPSGGHARIPCGIEPVRAIRRGNPGMGPFQYHHYPVSGGKFDLF